MRIEAADRLNSNKQILYIDMDGTLVNFQSGIDALDDLTRSEYEGRYDEVPGIFSKMKPMPNAIAAFNILCSRYDTYILSTAPWSNHTAWSDKLNWVKNNLGALATKRLILSHNKHLNMGDYLIDDRTANGADRFQGELILFGSSKFPNWKAVVNYL